MPLVRFLGHRLWEVRCTLPPDRIARVLFTGARLTQIRNLLLLAPDIQEAIRMQAGIPDFMTTGETKLRRLTTIADWEQQKIGAKGLGLRLA
jgi:hypothetical protein